MFGRKGRLRLSIGLALMLFIILMVYVGPNSARSLTNTSTGAVIDLFTEKTPFDGKGANMSSDAFEPQELVVLRALATYNDGPQCNMLVAFQVSGPLNAFENISFVGVGTTDMSGIAQYSFRLPWPCNNAEKTIFGQWTAIVTTDIAGQVVTDIVIFRVGWIVQITELATLSFQLQPRTLFSRLDLVVFNMTVQNIALTDKRAVIKVDAEDAMKNPIVYIQMQEILFPPGKSNVQASSQIPISAEVGLCNVSAVPLTGPIESGGRAYSPPIFTTFTVTERDIAITGLTLSSGSVVQGESIGIVVTVINKGNLSETFDLTVYYDSVAIETRGVTELSPFVEENLSFAWNTDSINPGIYTISASAPLSGDTNPSDNTFVDGTVEIKSGKPPEEVHDVAVLNIVPSPTVAEVGQTVNVVVIVKNKGLTNESFYVSVYYDHVQVGRKYVANLVPAAEAQLVFAWNTAGVPPLKYIISGVADTVEGETRTADNTFVDGTVTILPYPPFFPTFDWLVFSIIVVVAIIAGVVFLFLLFASSRMRRRKTRPVYTVIAHPHI